MASGKKQILAIIQYLEDGELNYRLPTSSKMFVVGRSYVSGRLQCIREVTCGVHLQTAVSMCRGCHIARLTARERCICRSRRSNSKISSVDTSSLRALRALSTSSKDGKSDKTTDTKSDERDSGSKLVDDARLSTGTETERMIRSIAEAVGDTGPMDHIEKLDKLDKALSKLEKLQLGINNSAKSQNPTITDLTSDTKQKLRDLRIKSKVASDIRKKQSEYYKKVFTDNNYLEVKRAKEEYLLTDKHLEGIPKLSRSNPYSSTLASHENIECVMLSDVLLKPLESIPKLSRSNPYSSTLASHENIECVMLSDVLWKVNEVHGSLENMEREKAKQAMRRRRTTSVLFSASAATVSKSFKERLKIVLNTCKNAFYHDDSGKVVFIAFVINFANAVFKFFVWIKTGSPSMFSEFMHSTGDTANQLMLAVGKYLSMKKPDSEHPYGYINHVNIVSIVSGVGIFCFGFGLTFYNGLYGLITPQIIDPADLMGALKVLSGSLVSELATLFTAVVRLHQDSKKANVSFWKYVKDAEDPLVNVVLLEDMSAVLGVIVCGGAMYLGVHTGIPRFDAVGSLVISAMLGAVSYFIVHTNADVLLGRSIPYQREIIKTLEQDRFIRSVMDSKGTDYGMYSRYKAELHLDGRQIALDYMDTIDTEELIKKLQLASSEESSELLTQFGEGCVDRVSVQIDRIEEVLKKKYPELRHIDLEV